MSPDELLEHDPPDQPRMREPISRSRVCKCGRDFVQSRLPEGFLAGVKARDLVASALLDEQLPGGWTPTQCPKCEHEALDRKPERGPPPGRTARVANAKQQPNLFDPRPSGVTYGVARGALQVVRVDP